MKSYIISASLMIHGVLPFNQMSLMAKAWFDGSDVASFLLNELCGKYAYRNYMHLGITTYKTVHTYRCSFVRAYVCIYTYMQAYTHIQTYMHIYIHTYIRTFMYPRKSRNICLVYK